MQEPSEKPNQFADLLRDLRDEVVSLFHEEVALAKSEFSEKTNRLIRNAVYCGVGAGVAFAGLFVLLIGLSYLLTYVYAELGMPLQLAGWLGPTSLGLLVVLIGWGLIAKARRAISRENLAPEQTLDSLRETKDWAQHKLHNTHEKPAV